MILYICSPQTYFTWFFSFLKTTRGLTASFFIYTLRCPVHLGVSILELGFGIFHIARTQILSVILQNEPMLSVFLNFQVLIACMLWTRKKFRLSYIKGKSYKKISELNLIISAPKHVVSQTVLSFYTWQLDRRSWTSCRFFYQQVLYCLHLSTLLFSGK